MSAAPTTQPSEASANQQVTVTLVQKLKKKAKGLGRDTAVAHHVALDMVAVEAGFNHWAEVAQRHKAFLGGREATLPEVPPRRPGIEKLIAKIQGRNPNWSQERVLNEAKSQTINRCAQLKRQQGGAA